MRWSTSVLLQLSTGSAFASATPFPHYAETFTVNTVESNTKEGVVVRQTLVRDVTLHRSMMCARGPLVRGVLQQIVRCDIYPLGWYADIGGIDDTHLQCTNQTRNPDPSFCQWSTFWAPPPPNASSQAVVLNGTACTRWIWWDGGEQFAFWGTATTPLRSAKLFTPHTGWVPWAIDYVHFVAATPADEAYAPLPGAHCPPASPPLTAAAGAGATAAGVGGAAVGWETLSAAGRWGARMVSARPKRLNQHDHHQHQQQQQDPQPLNPNPLKSWRLEIDTTVAPVVFFNHTLDACFETDVVDETLNAFRLPDGSIRMIGGNGGEGPCSFVGESFDTLRRDCVTGPVIKSRNDYTGPGDYPHNMWLPGTKTPEPNPNPNPNPNLTLTLTLTLPNPDPNPDPDTDPNPNPNSNPSADPILALICGCQVHGRLTATRSMASCTTNSTPLAPSTRGCLSRCVLRATLKNAGFRL